MKTCRQKKERSCQKIINKHGSIGNWALSPKFYDKNYKKDVRYLNKIFLISPSWNTKYYASYVLILQQQGRNATVLQISTEEFKAAEISMKAKLSVHGYNFDKTYVP